MAIDDNEMDQEDGANQTYRTATHELVHFYYQDNIVMNEEADRTSQYLIEVKPRLVRQMIYHNLINAYEQEDKRDEYLSYAKYWLDLYKQEHNQEFLNIKSTDIAEATARYTENPGDFIGENLSKEDSKKKAIENIQKEEIFESADSESYEIGYVAALLLDELKPDWKNNFYESGLTVEETLLENISPKTQKVDKDLEKKVTEKIQESNEFAKEAIDPISKALSDETIPFLKVDIDNAATSYTMQGNYNYQDHEIMAKFSSQYSFEGKTIDIKDQSIIFEFPGNGEGVIVVPLLKDYEYKDGVLTVNTSN